MTAENMHVAGLIDEALAVVRDHTTDTLKILEPQLEKRNTLLTRDIQNGDRFSYQLNDFHRVAADVAILRDRLKTIEMIAEQIDRKLRRAKR